jgi:DNA-directed RNA polymerase specialized sigma24 family protein
MHRSLDARGFLGLEVVTSPSETLPLSVFRSAIYTKWDYMAELDEGRRQALFRTTHWSVVLAASDATSPDAHKALTRLCQTYWYPLYCCARRHGRSQEDAQDLTQAFFTKLLSKNQIALSDRARGRFRTFLLHSFENFLRSEHTRATRQKRGGGRELVAWDAETAEAQYGTDPFPDLSPGEIFERRWASTLLSETLTRVRREFCSNSRGELFDLLEPHLWGDDTSTPYARIAVQLDMTVVAVRVTMHRLRSRYRDLLREEIAQTLGPDEDVDDELMHLRRVLTG